jgi:hypothetical protein
MIATSGRAAPTAVRVWPLNGSTMLLNRGLVGGTSVPRSAWLAMNGSPIDPARNMSSPEISECSRTSISPASTARRQLRASPKPDMPTYEVSAIATHPAAVSKSKSIPLFQPRRCRSRRPCRIISATAAMG